MFGTHFPAVLGHSLIRSHDTFSLLEPLSAPFCNQK